MFKRLGLPFILLFLVIGCESLPAEKVWVNAPGWSRAIRVEETAIPDSVPIAVDDAGISYLLLLKNQDDNTYPLFKAVDPSGNELWSTLIPEHQHLPNEPDLLWDGEQLRAYWVNDRKLYEARLDDTGDIIQPPTPLSGDHLVDTFARHLKPKQSADCLVRGHKARSQFVRTFSGAK